MKLKKDGAFYVVSPWALTWDDENYYLVAYDAADGIIKHYRVDKMQNTEILETYRKGEDSFKNFEFFILIGIKEEACTGRSRFIYSIVFSNLHH